MTWCRKILFGGVAIGYYLTSTFVSGEAMPAMDWLNPKEEARKPKPAPRPEKTRVSLRILELRV